MLCEGEGVIDESRKNKRVSESHFTQLKQNRHRKCTSVQKSEDYKTLMLMLENDWQLVNLTKPGWRISDDNVNILAKDYCDNA